MLKPLFAFAALAAVLPLAAAGAQTAALSGRPAAIDPADANPLPEDWRDIPDNEMLVLTLKGGQQVFIRLAQRYAPAHVANIRKLATAHWWDGTSFYRVQDNYVAQWGGGETKTELPPLVIANPPGEYDWGAWDGVTQMTRPDAYAVKSGHSADGWSLATDGKRTWIPHCYGTVGIARDLAPSTGSGSELYAVIGNSPRHLDRNIAVAGRVVEGIQWLSTLPRGTGGGLGLYESPSMFVPILSVRLASELPDDERPRFQYRATDNPRFAAWIKLRENRQPPFFTVPAGGADICNAEAPVRRKPAE